MSEPPRIVFPCAYPIHVIGYRDADFRTMVLRIVREYAPDLEEESVTVRDSRGGGYCSVRLEIIATGEAQLKALHTALLAQSAVKLVL